MKQRNIYMTGLALILLVLLSVGILTGCNNSAGTPTEIFIQSSNSPRLTYVQGQDLDLSRGSLTVTVDGEQHPVPLNSEGVSVTGYDMNTLGKQTLTVTYQGLTTTFDVTVIPRIAAENFETNYFVGDTFDDSKGRLKIARDDGSTFNVNLNSETVSLKSFDSSKEGAATVTVLYQDGGASYECTFNVTVYKADKVSFTPPKQTAYASHETELNLAGGYFTVQAAAPSDFTKYVNLTADMVSGYDPSKVTSENKDTPVSQVLTFTYAGQTFEFTVEITYSRVYMVNDAAEALKDLDWTGEEVPEFTDEQGILAADALTAYLKLSPAEQALVDADLLMAVVRPATVYLNTRYYDATLSFSKAFEINAAGYINIVGESYADVQDAVNRLKDPDNDFNVLAGQLNQIKSTFSSEMLVGTLTFEDAISAHTPESLNQLTPIFEFMLEVYDAMIAVPDTWKVQDLSKYGDVIETAVSKMVISSYVGISYNQFYDVISSWRTNDDYFDIIYSYYFYVKDNGRDLILSDLLGKVPAPGIVNDWYMAYMNAFSEAQKIEQYGASKGYLYDTTGFMYYYDQSVRLAKEVKASNNELYVEIFALMEGEEAMDIYLRRSNYGYIFQMGEALGLESVENVWTVYLALIDVYLNQPADTWASEHGDKFEAVTVALSRLSPAELHCFISTVNFLYDTSKGDTLVLDCSAGTYNTMMGLLGSYYRETISSDAVYNLFIDLFIAMENYSLYGIKDSATADLHAIISKMDNAYGKLSTEEKAVFDEKFGDLFAKYKAYDAKFSASSVTVPQGWEAKFNELNTLLDTFDTVYAYLLSSDHSDLEKSMATPLLFALYERAERLYVEISGDGSSAAATALASKLYTASGVEYTLERRFFGARAIFVNLTIASGIEDVNGNAQMTWDVYEEAGIQDFLADVAYLMLAEFNGKVYNGDDVAAMMTAFRALPAEKKVSFYKLGVNQLYYAAIERYYADQLGKSYSELVSALLQAEIAYSMYALNQESSYLNDFKTQMGKAVDLYNGLGNASAFDKALGATYTYYKDLYYA